MAGRGPGPAARAAAATSVSCRRPGGSRSGAATRPGTTGSPGGQGTVAAGGDPVVRDRDGQWSYGFSVVVDDLRQGIDLVVRGRDLLESTADQIRLGRLLGRDDPPTFAHHALILRPDGSKLSKADGATGIRELRRPVWTPAEIIAEAPPRSGSTT